MSLGTYSIAALGLVVVALVVAVSLASVALYRVDHRAGTVAQNPLDNYTLLDPSTYHLKAILPPGRPPPTVVVTGNGPISGVTLQSGSNDTGGVIVGTLAPTTTLPPTMNTLTVTFGTEFALTPNSIQVTSLDPNLTGSGFFYVTHSWTTQSFDIVQTMDANNIAGNGFLYTYLVL